MPSEVGPALDAANNGLAVLPKEKIDALLTETSEAVGGLGPALQRLVDVDDEPGARASGRTCRRSTTSSPTRRRSWTARCSPVTRSEQWSRNLNVIASQTAEQDAALRSGLQQAAPTLDQVLDGVQRCAGFAAADAGEPVDRHRHAQALQQGPRAGAGDAAAGRHDRPGGHDLRERGPAALRSVDQPAAAVPDRLPAGLGVAVARRTPAWRRCPRAPTARSRRTYQGNVVRGARNYPCADVPGKRAATPRECRSDEPYVPLGTNPWYGDPNQILACPAPGARCDQRVNPGHRSIPAPTVNNGMNPLPADQLPPRRVAGAGQRPAEPAGPGTVSCSGQQPNPCIYTPAPGTTR